MIPTAINPMGAGSVMPPYDEIWYYAPEKATLYSLDRLQSHTFANGKGILKLNTGTTTVGLWFYKVSTIKKVVLQGNCTTVGQYAFRECTGLEKVVFPLSVTELISASFVGCTNLVMSALPKNLTTIGMQTFQGCSKVTFRSIPAGVVTLDNSAFNYCTGITSLSFKGTPQSIHAYALQNMSNLTDIYVPWAEGEVANAPWGAWYSTIHYNS